MKVNSDLDEILHYNRLLLTAVGIWPLKPDANFLNKVSSLLLIIGTCLFCTIMMILQFITLYINWGDIGVMSEIGSMLLGFMVSFVTYTYMVSLRADFHAVYELIHEFWSTAKNQEERNSIVEFTNDSRICTVFYFYAVLVEIPLIIFAAAFVTLLNYATTNGTDYDRVLPNDLYYGSFCQRSPNYEILFAIQSLAVFFAGFAAAGLNTTTMSIVMHIAAQFRLISLRLKDIGRNISHGYELESEPTSALRMEIKLCIMHHQRVLRVFEYVNDLLGPVIFGLFIVAGIEICLTGWAVIESDSNFANIVKFAGLFMLMWLQLSLWCWSGEAIVRESSDIGRVVFYDIPWFILPCSLQRDLTFVVRRTQKQSQLEAMGWQIMHLKKLTEVFNTAVSYMALLRSMREK